MSTTKTVGPPAGYKKPKISSRVDGNIFMVMGATRRAMSKAGHSEELMKQMATEVTNSQSYDEALNTIQKWVDIV